jgi:hypothetical protein
MLDFLDVQYRLDSFDTGALMMHQTQLPLFTLINYGRAQPVPPGEEADRESPDVKKQVRL